MSSLIILNKFSDFALYSHKVGSLLAIGNCPHEGVPSQAKTFLEEPSKRVETVVTPPVSFQH